MSRKPEKQQAKPPQDASKHPVSGAKPGLHPRNPHRERYDFPKLIAASPELAAFVSKNAYGDESVDFADPAAVRALNRALLLAEYGIRDWDIPPQYLCPPIPGRADYLHHLADLLADENDGEIPRAVRALDIGTGANCIYPLIGKQSYGWQFVGTDIDRVALGNAQRVIVANGLQDSISLRLQHSKLAIFRGVVEPDDAFDVTLCNPPFHASLEEARAGTTRKWHNLGKAGAAKPQLNFGGQGAELWCAGGEQAFIARMVAESRHVRALWFTTLVSKADSLPAVRRALNKAGVVDSRVVEMAQGQKKSRFVAWTFLPESVRRAWVRARWG